MFKKTLISLAVASSLGLTGCFDSAETGANANPDYSISNPAIDGKTWPVFNPVTGELPLPNDLIFQKDDVKTVGVNEADGTFDVDDTKPPVTTAINRLSGASTVAPVDVAFNGTIQASSVDGQPFLVNQDGELILNSGVPVANPNQNVFLIELDYASGDPLQALSLSEPPTVPVAQPFAQIKATIKAGGTPGAGLVTAAKTAARAAVDQYKVDVIEQSGKSVIRINLLKPLNPKKRYIVAITNGVKDSLGEPIIPSPVYSSVTDPKAPLGTDELLPVRKIVNALWETVAEGYFALPNSTREAQSLPDISADNIAISYSFMTSDDEKILPYMAQPKDWFTDQVRALVRLGAVRKVAGAATVLSAAQSAVQDGDSPEVALKNALAAKRKSDDEVGANDTNGNGEIDPLDFDFNGDNDLTSADFNLSGTGDTPESPFNYFDVQAAIGAAKAAFPPTGLKLALPDLFGAGGACDNLNFEDGTACAGVALAGKFETFLPQIGDKSSSVDLPKFTDPEADIAALITPALSSVTGSDTAVVLQGSIELPYYLGIPTTSDGSTINNDIWTANHTLAEKLNTAFGPVGLQLAQGVKSPATGDYASDAVNYLFPFPKRMGSSDQKIPMLVMVPRPGTETAGGVTWDGTSKLPVVIFQHGITTDRSAALSVGSFLTAAGYGVVAIDLPLHGVDAQDQSDKTSGVAQEQQALANSLLAGIDAKTDASGGALPTQKTPANIAALINQTYVDQAVTFVQTNLGCTESDSTKIAAGGCTVPPSAGTAPAAEFVGFAIGAEKSVANYTSVIPGIARTSYERHFDFTASPSGTPIKMNFDMGIGSSGSLYINLQNFINSRDKNLQSQIDLTNLIASVGGIDVNGDGNGDFDTSKVYMIGHSLGTVAAAGATAVANQTDITDVAATALYAPASGITRLLENSPSFAPRILGGLQASGLEQGTQNYETFMRIVQSAIDPVDPINLADNIRNNGSIITFNIVGTEDGNGATLYKSDQTTIIEAENTQLNQAFPDYLTGGIALSEALGATNVVLNDGTQTSLASDLAYGTHGMYVLPSENSDITDDAERAADFQRQKDAFAESLLQTAEFLGNNGKMLGAIDAENGRLGVDADSTNDASTTPILDNRPIPTAQDVIDADNSDEFKQLN
jgi:pimeloyl-ACP methyl ester carboxylesterase